MIFLRLFLVFTKIGIFNYGGGYAMISLIHNEVVTKNQWMTNAEFTDIVAISQATPGPIGINSATYVGYTAVVNDGYPAWCGVLGALLATLSVCWLPFWLMIIVSRYLMRHYRDRLVTDTFAVLRPAIIGLIAAAAVLLMSADNFGSPAASPFQFTVSVLLFLLTFVGQRLYRLNPILLIVLAGAAGLLIY